MNFDKEAINDMVQITLKSGSVLFLCMIVIFMMSYAYHQLLF